MKRLSWGSRLSALQSREGRGGPKCRQREIYALPCTMRRVNAPVELHVGADA